MLTSVLYSTPPSAMISEPTRRKTRLVLGSLYLADFGLVLANATNRSPLVGVLVVAVVFFSTFITVLLLAIRWAQLEEGVERVQFRISTLMLIMLLVGAYLAVIRWIATESGATGGGQLVQIVMFSLMGIVMSIPAWLCVGEAMISQAARWARLRWAQRLLSLLYRRH